MNDDDPSIIDQVIEDDIDSGDLSDILDGEFSNDRWSQNPDESGNNDNIYLYYFGNDADSDGAMKTGNVSINLDGDSYTFFFKKTGNATGGRGRGVTGIDDNKYIYNYGARVKADSDDRYQLVEVFSTNRNGQQSYGSVDINSDNVTVKKLDPPVWSRYTDFKNTDDETVRYHYDLVEDDEDSVDFSRTDGTSNGNGYYLVNTGGNVQRNKGGVKDGNECYYYVNSNRNVILYTDTKTLRGESRDGRHTVNSNNAEDFISGYAGNWE